MSQLVIEALVGVGFRFCLVRFDCCDFKVFFFFPLVGKRVHVRGFLFMVYTISFVCCLDDSCCLWEDWGFAFVVKFEFFFVHP